MISKRIDKWVEWTKWPAAIMAVASLPLTTRAWISLLYQSPSYPGYLTAFVAGSVAFVLVARTNIARSGIATRVIEFERDVTQSLLATMMLHPVVGFGKRDINHNGKGSRVRWLGRGNWVMLAAPYFIPTTAILLWLVSLILFQSLRSLILGFGISYHLVAVVYQCRSGTSELRRLGSRFCWMFLPAANFMMAGCATAFALNGFTGVGDFLSDWARMPYELFHWLWPTSESK
jgi:hypothetical protein